jgi:hypothetical protein
MRSIRQRIRKAEMTGQVTDITYEAMRRQVDKMKGADKRTRAMMK